MPGLSLPTKRCTNETEARTIVQGLCFAKNRKVVSGAQIRRHEAGWRGGKALSFAKKAMPYALDALRGQGEDMVRMIVVEWRLPHVLLAILSGSAPGMSGAIFQSLTRSPLGNPDIIGFAAGSYTGALIVILLLSGGYYEIAAGALTGGILTAIAVYALAWRNGAQGFWLIIVGIGISAMLSAFNGWMIRAADLNVAMAAAIWGAGSLNGLSFDQLVPVAIVLSF